MEPDPGSPDPHSTMTASEGRLSQGTVVMWADCSSLTARNAGMGVTIPVGACALAHIVCIWALNVSTCLAEPHPDSTLTAVTRTMLATVNRIGVPTAPGVYGSLGARTRAG